MIKHPDGENLTRELISLASLKTGARILDMGAGDGEAVLLLRSLGFDAVGLDRTAAENITAGDMTALPFEDGSFDAVISECAFSVCGDAKKAFLEACRVLKKDGLLLISDVYFKNENAPTLSLKTPATKDGWENAAQGFTLSEFHDRTKVWTEFMIHCLWNGLDLGDCGYFKAAAKAKGGYFIAAFKKNSRRYAGIITAAGLSSRMGSFKPLLEINGIPMIAHTVMSMQNAALSPVCVVTGHRGDEIRTALKDYDVIFAENENFNTTDMLASVKCGLEMVKKSEGFFLLPGDMPLIPPETFKAVSSAAGNYIIPKANGKSAHPPLIKKPCYDAILNFGGDGGLKKALDAFEKTYIETGNAELNRDADYSKDFEILSETGKKTLGLSQKLCTELFDEAGTPQHIRAHGIAVGMLSLRMAKKLISCGYPINALLCQSAGTLHDICRLDKMHAESGARFLEKHGYTAVSDIVKHHMTSDGLSADMNEHTIVFLADKLLRETELVTPKERYAPAFSKFPKGTETGDRIRKDCAFAEQLLKLYTDLTGDKI